MIRLKLQDAVRLIKSRAYIFINERESIMRGEFDNTEAFSVLHALAHMKSNLAEATQYIENKYFKKGTKDAEGDTQSEGLGRNKTSK